MITRHLIQFGHDRHYHIQTVAPPPVIMIGCTHLILHHFAGTGYLIVVRKNSIKVDICLKTNLIISEQYIFITLTVRVFPFRLILFLGSLPFIVYSPDFRICTVVFITGQKVCLHVSGVVSGIVPKRTDFGLVMRLPISVYLVYNPRTSLASEEGLAATCMESSKVPAQTRVCFNNLFIILIIYQFANLLMC